MRGNLCEIAGKCELSARIKVILNCIKREEKISQRTGFEARKPKGYSIQQPGTVGYRSLLQEIQD